MLFLFSSAFLIRSDSSAACEASASFCVAVASLSSLLSRSSSSSWILLLRAATSPSASSRQRISTWSFLAMSSLSSLYFSISSFVCLIFFLRTSRRLFPCTCAILVVVVGVVGSALLLVLLHLL